MTIQNIGRKLNKIGLKKMTWDPKIGESVGNYKLNKLSFVPNVLGTLYINSPRVNKSYDGPDMNEVKEMLDEAGIDNHIKNGYIVLTK